MIDPAINALARRYPSIVAMADGRIIVDGTAAAAILADLHLPAERKPLPESRSLADIKADGHKSHGAAPD